YSHSNFIDLSQTDKNLIEGVLLSDPPIEPVPDPPAVLKITAFGNDSSDLFTPNDPGLPNIDPGDEYKHSKYAKDDWDSIGHEEAYAAAERASSLWTSRVLNNLTLFGSLPPTVVNRFVSGDGCRSSYKDSPQVLSVASLDPNDKVGAP